MPCLHTLILHKNKIIGHMEVRLTGEQQVHIVIFKFCVLSGQRQSVVKQVHFKKKIPLSPYPVDFICFFCLFVCFCQEHHCGAFVQKDASIYYNLPFALSLTLLCIIDELFVVSHDTLYLTRETTHCFSGRRPWVPWVMTRHWRACPTSTP